MSLNEIFLQEVTANTYVAEHAQRKTLYRHSSKTKAITLTDHLKARIAELMCHNKWSPELIAKRLAKEGEVCVSHETIYKWIWTAKHNHHRKHKDYKNLHKHLRHTGSCLLYTSPSPRDRG